MAWFVVSLFVVILFGELPPFNMIDGAFLKYFGIPVAFTWFVSQKTFDGKKPFGFLKSAVTFALRPKVTYAGKQSDWKRKDSIPLLRQLGVWCMFPIKYIETIWCSTMTVSALPIMSWHLTIIRSCHQKKSTWCMTTSVSLLPRTVTEKSMPYRIATEDSLRAVQERSKKGITGRLKEIACKKVDEQTESVGWK